jgi:hypothetical protein
MARKAWPVALSLLLVNWSAGAAQTESLEWVAFGGLFVPTADLARTTFVQPPLDAAEVKIKQAIGPVVGARLVAWWGTVGWESAFAYAFSEGRVNVTGVPGPEDVCAETPGAECGANVWYASSKLLFRFAPQPYRGWYVFSGAGLAVAGHLGDLWERSGAFTDLGVVVNVGGVIDISRRFAIRIDAEDYIYQFKAKVEDDPVLGTTVVSSKWQNDLVFTAGLVIRIQNF